MSYGATSYIAIVVLYGGVAMSSAITNTPTLLYRRDLCPLYRDGTILSRTHLGLAGGFIKQIALSNVSLVVYVLFSQILDI